MLHELIRTRVVSSFCVVEEGRDRFVLQATRLDSLGVAAVFFFMGGSFLFAGSTFQNRVSSVSAMIVGGAFCSAGCYIAAAGFWGKRRRIVFDRVARHVRREPAEQGSSPIPFSEITGVRQSVIEGISDIDSSLVYHRLSLTTNAGEDIELCLSRDEQLIEQLAFKTRAVLDPRSVQGPPTTLSLPDRRSPAE